MENADESSHNSENVETDLLRTDTNKVFAAIVADLSSVLPAAGLS